MTAAHKGEVQVATTRPASAAYLPITVTALIGQSGTVSGPPPPGVPVAITGPPVVVTEGLPYPVVILGVVPAAEGFAVHIAAVVRQKPWSVGEALAEYGDLVDESPYPPAPRTPPVRPPLPFVAAVSAGDVEYIETGGMGGSDGDIATHTTEFEPALPAEVDEVTVWVEVG